MTQHEREQIVKAMECCTARPRAQCSSCPYFLGNGRCKHGRMQLDALALIRELTEENERLERICESFAFQHGTATDKEAILKKERADTVRKMQDAISKRCIEVGIYPAFVARVVEKVAEDIIGGQTDEG